MYSKTMERMKNNLTDGSEFGEKIDGVKIGHTNCDYCGCEVIAVWDENNIKNYWPYLGNQFVKPNVYKGSKIAQRIRNNYNCQNKVFRQENGNNLLNVHARCHSSPTDWSRRASKESIRLLCNSCFQKTYNRIKVKGDNSILYALSVLPDRGETIESVMKDLNISGKVLGKGGIVDYD